jgi:hypothetical protein
MTLPSLGRLERVEARTIWKVESGEFTPWLAKEENLVLLGDAIGMELELEAAEKSVGLFRADLLCRDTASGNWVLIENQLERTDHRHLGQLITYAAGLKAVTIVWVANPFTEEHRAALDWLNEVTRDSINFFGLEVELWRIGTSPVAPKFNVVCEPNDWSESVSNAATALTGAAPTETKQLQLEYWSALSGVLKQAHSPVKPQKPLAQHWTNFALGKSNVYLVAVVNTVDAKIGVHVALVGDTGKTYYSQLLQEKTAIENEFGQALEWRELPGRKESQVGLILSADPTTRAEWPVQHQWLKTTLEKMHVVFAPRAKALQLPSEPTET